MHFPFLEGLMSKIRVRLDLELIHYMKTMKKIEMSCSANLEVWLSFVDPALGCIIKYSVSPAQARSHSPAEWIPLENMASPWSRITGSSLPRTLSGSSWNDQKIPIVACPILRHQRSFRACRRRLFSLVLKVSHPWLPSCPKICEIESLSSYKATKKSDHLPRFSSMVKSIFNVP